jgi:hypothetical protein
MNIKKWLVAGSTVMLFGAGCSGGTSTTPVVPAPAAPAAAPTSPPPAASASTATITLTGAVEKSGTYEARCAPYFPLENKGIVFDSFFESGWHLQVGDGENRREGVQNPVTLGILNGPTASYTLVQEGARVVFGPGLQSATVNAKFKRVLKEEYINVVASFDCK